ncbi:ribonuclease R, partial [Rhizobium sp. BR5]
MSKAPRQRQGSASDGFGRTGRGKRVSEGEGIIHGEVPSREVLLKFIADHPQQASKREIAKAFGLKGEDRIVLKALLKELEVDGMVHKSRKSLTRPGGLPPVTVLDITTRDKDGELIGRPAEWPEDLGAAPAVLIRQSSQDRGKKAPAAGLGDRILAKIFPSKESTGPAYTARVVKLIDRRQNALLGVFKETEGGGGRLMPIDRRGEEMVIDPDGVGDAKDGDLIEVETSRNSGRYGLTRAKVLSVIGSVASEKAISMIAIHAHGIPHIFPQNVMAEADAAKAATMSHREDWRDLPLITIDPADAKDHDDAVYAE